MVTCERLALKQHLIVIQLLPLTPGLYPRIEQRSMPVQLVVGRLPANRQPAHRSSRCICYSLRPCNSATAGT